MRIAIVGQKDFGKAALDAFLERGDTVAGVFCAPEKPGEAADALREAAEQAGDPARDYTEGARVRAGNQENEKVPWAGAVRS